MGACVVLGSHKRPIRYNDVVNCVTKNNQKMKIKMKATTTTKKIDHYTHDLMSGTGY